MKLHARLRDAGLVVLIVLFALTQVPSCNSQQPAVPQLPPPAVGRIQVKFVVVANFEPGEDTGDAPGEFQLWAEREHMDETIAIKGALHPLRRNKEGLYGIRWGSSGNLVAQDEVVSLTALVLDPRFDFSKTYWLFTGISGVDPNVASVGSAAWARWVVGGDAMREFDDREIPADWPYGLFAIGAKRPNELPNDPHSYAGMTGVGELGSVIELNQGLTGWAFEKTKNVRIPDSPSLQKERSLWRGYPNAQRPPFVLIGETLGTWRYWHGVKRTQWAEDWVRLWTGGKGTFVMTNMESQTMTGAMWTLSKQGLVDFDRVMVLRTASNPSMPPPGVLNTQSVGDEGPGQMAAFEANYRVGVPIAHEIIEHWSKYENSVPSK
jgi:purine nucleoside permease